MNMTMTINQIAEERNDNAINRITTVKKEQLPMRKMLNRIYQRLFIMGWNDVPVFRFAGNGIASLGLINQAPTTTVSTTNVGVPISVPRDLNDRGEFIEPKTREGNNGR